MNFLQITFMVYSIFFSCCTNDKLPVVSEVDLNKYSGTWYEIAKLPNRFEKGLDCVTATYTPGSNGTIEVFNRGRKITKKTFNEIKGIARIPDKSQPAKLKVQFFWPFSGKYHILELDKNYQYVLVGEPSRKYLWILCRNKELDKNIYEMLLQKAAALGFDVSKVVKTNQNENQ